MLVRPDGTYVCSLSGGCLEPAVAEAAALVITSGEPVTVGYDLADDSVWGLNLGCSGAVDIRIERIDDDEATTAWLGALERGDAVVLVTRLTGAAGRRVVIGGGASVGTLGDATLDAAADMAARGRLAQPQAASGSEAAAGEELFFDVNQAPPELIVFGAGPDAEPLVQQAWRLGFDVTVVDPRAAHLRHDTFPRARLILVPFEDLATALPPLQGSFALVMSHHLDRDRSALRFCFSGDPAYIGVLGPRARYEKVLGELARDGYSPPPHLAERVHSPVGLALGAESPEEVAVSILAEILAIRRGFGGGFLSGSTDSLHRSVVNRAMARS
jgi:xanthine/CO dehydrogenase XdhC/CoxF family maturation factor